MPKNDKRSRLVLAADELFHKKGVATTTLANIAELSEVPLGNVYYYFKSKESIVLAVIQYRKQIIQENLERLNSSCAQGIERLKGYLDQILDKAHREEYGDPLGSLCQELMKQTGTPAEKVSELMQEITTWVKNQIEAFASSNEQSYQQAAHFVACTQGIHLLGLTFKDLNLVQAKCEIVHNWLKNL